MTDEQLLADYVKGDPRAFATLYHKHKGGVYRYILRQIKQKDMCDDLFQEVWQKVIVSSATFQPNAKFTTWLYTLARNRIIDEIRHLNVVADVIQQNDIHSGSTQLQSGDCLDMSSNEGVSQFNNDTELGRQRNKQQLLHCLNKLPLYLLDAFVLKEESGLTGPQIAEVVNASVEATKSRLRTAYAQLRLCLTLYDESSGSSL